MYTNNITGIWWHMRLLHRYFRPVKYLKILIVPTRNCLVFGGGTNCNCYFLTILYRNMKEMVFCMLFLLSFSHSQLLLLSSFGNWYECIPVNNNSHSGEIIWYMKNQNSMANPITVSYVNIEQSFSHSTDWFTFFVGNKIDYMGNTPLSFCLIVSC